MPQVIFLAAIGAGIYTGVRALMRITQSMAADMAARESEARQSAEPPVHEKDLGTLEYDPRSGVYKPAAPTR